MARTALVTGCSTGIGRATAEAFGDAGWRVYATTRDRAACDPFDADGVTVLECDVTEQADADRAVERAVAETGRLDCLVNNAGYGQFGPLEDVPADAVGEQFDVNLLGPHRMARAALPHLREPEPGRIVNVGSVDDRLALPGTGAYTASKFALAGLTAVLRQEVAGQGVDVVLVEPGLIATGFLDRAQSTLPEADRTDAYESLYRVLERVDVLGDGDLSGVGDPADVAAVIREAATAADPDARYQAGPLGTPGVLAAEWLPRPVCDGAARAVVRAAASDPGQRLLSWAADRGQ